MVATLSQQSLSRVLLWFLALSTPLATAYVHGHSSQDTRTSGLVDRVLSPPLDLVTQPWTGDFDGMVRRRRIRLLTPYSRTLYFVDKGVQRGTVHDFGVKLEQELNERLKTTPQTRVHVVFVPTARNELFEALIEGRGDMIAAGVTATPERAGRVDFTVPGQTNVRRILVTGPTTTAVHLLDDLAGRKVAVRENSLDLESLLSLNVRLQRQGRAPVAISMLDAGMEDDDVLEMVNAGLIETAFVDDFTGAFWAQILPDLRPHPNIVLRRDDAVAWAVRKGSPQLLAVLNPLIETHRVGTLFGNVVLQRHLKRARLVGPATGAAALSRFRALIDTFRRHADRYDLDYRLMMAQAYQESGLDQKARSRRGAIGIMQLMPDTARHMKVGDVRELEPNVHAGVKYIRFIIDQHLGRTPIDALNQSLIAFAAYNCGPARVGELRLEARRRGLNPDVWFNHLELVAADRVGEETVQYVSNIYKYYVAYKLTADEQ